MADGAKKAKKAKRVGRIARGRDDHASREEIVRAALRIIDEDGVEGLTMRRLAGAVGLRAPSLYHHFPTKAAVVADVLDLVWDEVFANVDESVDNLTEWAVAAMVAVRRTFVSHPNMAIYIATLPRPGPRLLDSVDSLRVVVDAMAFPDSLRAFEVIRTYVFGSITLAASSIIASRYLERDVDAVRDYVLEAVADADDKAQALERATFLEIVVEDPSEETFAWGLRQLIAGLRRDER